MTEISMDLIKKLRDRTGVGIGKCKEALEKANGDIEQAITDLRKAGMASAVKKAGRETNEGMIGFAETDERIAIVEVNAETDFVVKNEKFGEFLLEVANEVAQTSPSSLEDFLKQKYSKDAHLTIDEFRGTIVQMIGENIQISRITDIAKKSNQSVGIYSHMNGKIVTAIVIEGSDQEEELARDIAMHAAAAAPDFLKPETVPQDIIEHEREIARTQLKGKPENMLDKILEGKLKAYYSTACLICQKYIRDESLTIEELVKKRSQEIGKPLEITFFLRWSVGNK
ncbi:MAG: translation elongation factor Ts [Chlamydiales bacterium]